MNKMCVPIFPKLEAKIAEKGLNYTIMGNTQGMGGQNFARRMRGETEFDLAEVMWLITYFDCEFEDLF